jgi:hypothetical protein
VETRAGVAISSFASQTRVRDIPIRACMDINTHKKVIRIRSAYALRFDGMIMEMANADR